MEIVFVYIRQFEYFSQLQKEIQEFGRVEEAELRALPFYKKQAREMLPQFIVLFRMQIHASNLKLLLTHAKIGRLAYRVFPLDKRKIYLYDIFNQISVGNEDYLKIVSIESSQSKFEKSLNQSKHQGWLNRKRDIGI